MAEKLPANRFCALCITGLLVALGFNAAPILRAITPLIAAIRWW
jgi:hypothetical protein